MASDLIDVTLSLYPLGSKSAYRAQWSSSDMGLPTEQGDSDIVLSRDMFDSPILTRLLPIPPSPLAALIRDAKEIGEQLYERVFQGNIKHRYDEAYETARRSQRRLRLRIHLPDELENLPFELLYDKRHDLFIGANEFTTLVRGSMGKTVELASAKFPLRLLIVAAQPSGVATINVDHEIDIITRGLSGLVGLGIWQVEVLRGQNTLQQLRDRNDRRQFHVLHYIGHGVIENELRALVLENEWGEIQLAETSTVSAVLVGYTNLRLVILSSCYGGQGVEGTPYASLAHHLLRTEIPAVVSMQRRIADDSAIRFTGELYRELSEGNPVDECVNSARMTLLLSGTTNSALDWFNPQVYLRSASGQLFADMESVFPWEERVHQAFESRNSSEAVRIFEEAKRWHVVSTASSDRLVQRLVQLAEASVEQHDWDSLAEILGHCPRIKTPVPSAERWTQILDNRRYWQLQVLNRLRSDLESGDLGRASSANAVGRELIDLPIHNPVEARRRMYDGDAHLFERFWANDIREVQKLLETYQGPLLTPQLLQVADALEALHDCGGLPTEPPASFDFQGGPGRGCQAGEAGPLRLIDKLIVHPVVDLQRLRSARERLLSDQSHHDDTLDQLLVHLKPMLDADFPLLLRALGMSNRAVDCWLSDFHEARDRHERLRIHHHLALTAFVPRVGLKVSEAVAFDDRALACWAVLLSEDEAAPESYWAYLRAASPRVEQSGEPGAVLIERLKNAILHQLCQPTARTDSPKVPAALRDIVLVNNKIASSPSNISASRPTQYSDRAFWFFAELAGAQMLRRLGPDLPALRFDPPMGFTGCRIFNLLDRVQALHNELRQRLVNCEQGSPRAAPADEASYDPNTLLKALQHQTDMAEAEPVSGDPWRRSVTEVRILFSTLRTFWTIVKSHDDAQTCLLTLGQTTLQLPTGDPAWDSHHLQFVQKLPAAWRVRISPCPVQDFHSENPLHGSEGAPLRVYCEDLRRVYLLAITRKIRQALWEETSGSSAMDPLVELVVGLKAGLDDVQPWIDELQSHAVLKSTEYWATDNVRSIRAGIDMLRVSARMDRNTSVVEAISLGLMRLASVLVSQHADADDVLACLVEARQWNPDSAEACEGLCIAMLARIKMMLHIGNSGEARYHVKELREQLDTAPFLTAQLIKISDEFDELEQQASSAQAMSTEGMISEPWNFSTTDNAWRERLDLAEQASNSGQFAMALDALSDAALLVAEESAESSQIRDKFLEIGDATEDVELRVLILEKGLRFFPDDVVLRDRLRRVRNIVDRLLD